MKKINGYGDWCNMECSEGHIFHVSPAGEKNLDYDIRIGLYAVCPECGETELNEHVRDEAYKLGVSVTSFNEASNFAYKHNLDYDARKELAFLLEATWRDGVKAEQVCSALEKL